MNGMMKYIRGFAEAVRMGGLSEEEYRRVKPLLRENNYRNWYTVCPLCTVYFSVIFLLSFRIGSISANECAYFAMTLVFAAASVLLRTCVKQDSRWMMPVIYGLNVSLFAFSIAIGTCLQTKFPAVTIMALMIALPQITVEVPYIMGGIVTVSAAAGALFCILFKQADVRSMELLNIICFWIISIVANTRILCERLKGYLNQYNVEEESYRDPLTHVKNKAAYQKDRFQLQSRLAKHPEEPFALVMADINGLKRMNDTYGHERGDDYIVHCCQKLCEVFMHSPVYRIGGDEFLIILRGRDYQHRAVLLGMAEDSVTAPGNSADPWNRADFALGLGEHDPAAGDDFDEVFNRADEAMYASKRRIYADRARVQSVPEKSSAELPESMRPCVLVISGENAVRKCVRDILLKKYRVREASDSEEGLCALLEGGISLVLLDITEDGFDFLKGKREDAQLSNVPVIVLTGVHGGGEEKCLQLGAKDVIDYPCSPDVLTRRVHNFIKYREARDALREVEYDSLTGVLTRQGFLRKMEKLFSANPDTDYSLLVTDVEDFRNFIERYGMDAGDELLRKIAEGLREAVGNDGIVGRVGVDRFGCVMPADKMREESGAPAVYGRLSGQEVVSGVRFVGKASLYEHVDRTLSPTVLCSRASSALAAIRHQYDRNLTVYNENENETRERRSRMEQDMRVALEKGQFRVYYQPKHDTVTGRLVGAEALLRWVHPELGMLSTQEFIPMFERSGFITHADLYAWKRTCENQRRWLNEGLTVVPVSVNASRRDFELGDLLERMRGLMEEHSIDPTLMHIEVTESLFSQQMELVTKRLTEARKAGIAVELDDFGTGYSSLAMLAEMPLDILKLDMSFVAQEIGAKRARILAATVNLARSLGLSTIAEGVETQELRDLLRSLGCGVIQGYYFSKPIPEDEFENYLRRSMDDGMKASENEKPAGSRCYVIDQDYNILSFNREAGEMYPQLKKGEKCHKCLMNAGQPCDICPVKNGVSGPTVYLDPIRNVYETVDAVEIPLEDGTMGHALVLSEVPETKK